MTPDQFRQFADLLPEPMFLLSGQGVILAINAAADERLGLPLGESAGKHLAEIASDPPEEIAHYLRACSRSRKLVLGAVTLTGKDGLAIVCRAEGAVLRPRSAGVEPLLLLRLHPKASAIGEFVALNRKIADLNDEIRRRKQAEFVIAEQGERLRTTLASIGDAVMATDTDGCITHLNAVAESLTGWKNSEAVGQPLHKVFRIVDEETRKPVENPAARALREGVIVGLANHTILIAKDGTERAIDDSAAPIRCKVGEIVGCVLVFRDVTERRRADEELRRVAAELSEANRRKDEFLATLAHELRNPMAPLRNALHILNLTGGNRQVFEQTREMMERQLQQLVRLDDLLDVSRITRGKLELRKERVGLAMVVQSAVETSRPVIEASKHDLTVTVPQEPIYVDADVTRLAQVFANLLNNSAKYTPRGGRILLIAERRGGDVVVTVRDNGVGIPASMLPHIFEMFTQVDRTLERSQGGLGIGLTLVRRLLELHGGTVEARSAGHGLGSEFIVRLPLAFAATPAALQLRSGEGDSRSARPKHTIVVADDNEDSATSLTLMLRIMGHEVHVVHDGLAAVQAAGTLQPNVVLLDIGMPRLNGYEAAQRIRQQPWGKRMVLIALTGWGQEEDRRRSEEAGFDHHLVKPADPAALEKLLASVEGTPT